MQRSHLLRPVFNALLKRAAPSALGLAALALVLSGCSPVTQAGAASTPADSPALTIVVPMGATLPTQPAGQCAAVPVLPGITEISPARGVAGSPLKVLGSGGFTQDDCGAYNESAKTFPLFLDDAPVGELSCYVNHCEVTITLPKDTSAGTHCLSLKKGACDFEFQVDRP